MTIEPPVSQPSKGERDKAGHLPNEGGVRSAEEHAKLKRGYEWVRKIREQERAFALPLTLGVLLVLGALFTVTIESAVRNSAGSRTSADRLAAGACAEGGISDALSMMESPQGVAALASGQTAQLDTCSVDYRGQWDGEHWTLVSVGHVNGSIVRAEATYPPLTYTRTP